MEALSKTFFFPCKNDRHLTSQRDIVPLLTNRLKLVLIFVNTATQCCMVQGGRKFKILDQRQRLVFRGEENILHFDHQISDVLNNYHHSSLKVQASEQLYCSQSIQLIYITALEINTFETIVMDIKCNVRRHCSEHSTRVNEGCFFFFFYLSIHEVKCTTEHIQILKGRYSSEQSYATEGHGNCIKFTKH